MNKAIIQEKIDLISREAACLKKLGLDTNALFDWIRKHNIELALNPTDEAYEDFNERRQMGGIAQGLFDALAPNTIRAGFLGDMP